MNDVLEASILVAGIIGAVVILVVAMRMKLKKREFLHQERLAAIEKGLEIPQAVLADGDTPSPGACLLRGMIWLSTGIGIGIFFVAMALSEGDSELYAASTIGGIPAGVGIAYLVMYRKTSSERAAKRSGTGAAA